MDISLFTDFYSALILMAVLGLRHGIDPDHIAIIDSMTLRLLRSRPALAPWVGTLFALGHGMTVTLIAVLVNLLSHTFMMPPLIRNIIEYLPVALLLLVGSLNLHALLQDKHYQPLGLKQGLIPVFLRSSSHPMAIIAIGILFAAMFDTATQAAAWGYAASAKGGVGLALVTGVIFSLGMMLTDTLDGRLMCRLIEQAGQMRQHRYRRTVGWLVVCLSFGVAFYTILGTIYPALLLSELAWSWFGGLLVALLLVGYIKLGHQAT